MFAGDPLPERMSLENKGKRLVITDECKDGTGTDRHTDLMVIQCNASNTHGYAYSAGYINVLGELAVCYLYII